MWWNSAPPWMQGMGQGGQPMTPGAGMPPYSRAPMNMNPVQMGPPGAIAGAPSPAGRPQQPLNPAQMGMLSAMLSQQTQKPGDSPPGAMTGRWSQISPQAMEGVIPGVSGQAAKDYMQGLSPDPGLGGFLSGLLARLRSGQAA